MPDQIIEWPDGDELPAERGSILVRNDRDPLFGMSREAFEERLISALSGRALEAYFFGSYGTNEFGPDSDVDIIIVVDTDLPFLRRGFEFADLLDILPSMDILVYTPEEFRLLTGDPSPGFWRSVVDSLKRISFPANLE